MTVRRGGPAGTTLFTGTVDRGKTLPFTAENKLWVYVTTPENLHIVVDGRTVVVHGLRPRVAVVTKTGWHTRS